MRSVSGDSFPEVVSQSVRRLIARLSGSFTFQANVPTLLPVIRIYRGYFEYRRERFRFEMRRMKSRLHNRNSLSRRNSSHQLLERRDLLAGDSGVMVEFAVVSDATVPDDVALGRNFHLPQSMSQTHEWDRFAVEIWVHGDGASPVDVQDLSLDLTYRTDLTSATGIEFGKSFEGPGSFAIDDARGKIQQLHGSTSGVSLDADQRVLFARIFFQAVPQNGDNVRLDHQTGSVGPYSLELQAENLAALNAAADVGIAQSTMPDLGIFPVIYDLNDDQRIGMSDFSDFVTVFGQTVENPGDGLAWFADFDKSQVVGLSDFSYLVQNFGKTYLSENIQFPANYPSAWTLPEETGNGDGGNGDNGNGGTDVGGGDPNNDTGNGGGSTAPPPVFLLDEFQVGITLPGTNDLFQIIFAGVQFQPGMQIERLTGHASLSEGGELGDDEVILTIVLEDEEVYETEIELIFDGEMIDSLSEFNEFSGYITAYVSEVMSAVQDMLEDALTSSAD